MRDLQDLHLKQLIRMHLCSRCHNYHVLHESLFTKPLRRNFIQSLLIQQEPVCKYVQIFQDIIISYYANLILSITLKVYNCLVLGEFISLTACHAIVPCIHSFKFCMPWAAKALRLMTFVVAVRKYLVFTTVRNFLASRQTRAYANVQSFFTIVIF